MRGRRRGSSGALGITSQGDISLRSSAFSCIPLACPSLDSRGGAAAARTPGSHVVRHVSTLAASMAATRCVLLTASGEREVRGEGGGGEAPWMDDHVRWQGEEEGGERRGDA